MIPGRGEPSIFSFSLFSLSIHRALVCVPCWELSAVTNPFHMKEWLSAYQHDRLQKGLCRRHLGGVDADDVPEPKRLACQSTTGIGKRGEKPGASCSKAVRKSYPPVWQERQERPMPHVSAIHVFQWPPRLACARYCSHCLVWESIRYLQCAQCEAPPKLSYGHVTCMHAFF